MDPTNVARLFPNLAVVPQPFELEEETDLLLEDEQLSEDAQWEVVRDFVDWEAVPEASNFQEVREGLLSTNA